MTVTGYGAHNNLMNPHFRPHNYKFKLSDILSTQDDKTVILYSSCMQNEGIKHITLSTGQWLRRRLRMSRESMGNVRGDCAQCPLSP